VVKLNTVERWAMNNPIRAVHQRTREAAWFADLSRGKLKGADVLEVGCGRGVGIEVLLDRLGARRVTAFDLDAAMVQRAQRRLRRRSADRVRLSTGDATEIAHPAASFDAVVDFGIIHHVPHWQQAVGEISRVLRPGGLLLFEEVPRHVLDSWVLRTFTDHPRTNRFEADEFAAELGRHGLQGSGQLRSRLGGMVFTGAAVRVAG
jgi:ubiquinone/menaquinone biosynthesis C-methylase UbiE